MSISIQKIYNNGSRQLNEDEILLQDNLFAVFDGASSLVKWTSKKGETGGKLAAKIAKNVFLNNDKSLKQLASKANNTILNTMIKERINIKKKKALWAVVFAAIRIGLKEVEFLSIGDCLILVIFKNGSHKLLTPYKDHDQETMVEWKKFANEKTKDIWEVLKPQIDKVRREANIKYGCLNGQKEAISFLTSGKIRLDSITSIILFTDGLLLPKEKPDQPEDWNTFVTIYQRAGLKGILNHVRFLEKKDPHCWKYPRFKQHDDIAAIGIDFW